MIRWIRRIQRVPKRALVTAAAVIAAAAFLSFAVLTRGEGPGALVAVRPSASVAVAPQASATSSGASASSPSAGATPTEVPAPTLNDVTPTTTPKPDPNAASPTFPPSWNGKLVPASPTPSPRAEMWRLEGVVIDPSGSPVKDVCVAIGPHGCQATSPRSDANGVYWTDLPKADVTFDLHFFRDGFQTADRSIHPFGPTRLDVLLQG